MGWYTTNASDTFQWKYGDVIALARASTLGELRLMPRLSALDADGEIFDGEEFLGPLQRWALSQSLAWKRPIPFDPDDKTHETVIVPADVDVEKTLKGWARVLRMNKKPLLAALKHFNDFEDDEEVVEVSLSTEALWTLPASGYDALVAWLNAPLSGRGKKGSRKAPAAAFDLKALREGTFDEYDEYSPSEATKAALSALPKGDASRVMAAYALGHALLEEAPLELYMPDDAFHQDVWGGDGE